MLINVCNFIKKIKNKNKTIFFCIKQNKIKNDKFKKKIKNGK